LADADDHVRGAESGQQAGNVRRAILAVAVHGDDKRGGGGFEPVIKRAGLAAIQVLGGYGYIREFPVERLMRDAKLIEIGGGTSEILRNVVVAELRKGY